jgi:hypothetical protein
MRAQWRHTTRPLVAHQTPPRAAVTATHTKPTPRRAPNGHRDAHPTDTATRTQRTPRRTPNGHCDAHPAPNRPRGAAPSRHPVAPKQASGQPGGACPDARPTPSGAPGSPWGGRTDALWGGRTDALSATLEDARDAAAPVPSQVVGIPAPRCRVSQGAPWEYREPAAPPGRPDTHRRQYRRAHPVAVPTANPHHRAPPRRRNGTTARQHAARARASRRSPAAPLAPPGGYPGTRRYIYIYHPRPGCPLTAEIPCARTPAPGIP